jgi:serum/glucocorticoid-regulated kinase 2
MVDVFGLFEVIGKGFFGKVMQDLRRDMQRAYALKTIRKDNIASRPGQINHILAERTVLAHVEVRQAYAVAPRPGAFRARTPY